MRFGTRRGLSLGPFTTLAADLLLYTAPTQRMDGLGDMQWEPNSLSAQILALLAHTRPKWIEPEAQSGVLMPGELTQSTCT